MTSNQLGSRDHELVALGASIASNCIPCVKYHIAESRKSGLSDGEIRQAVEIAEMVRQVPARKVSGAARAMLGMSASEKTSSRGAAAEKSCCGNFQDSTHPQGEQEQERGSCDMPEMMARCRPQFMRMMQARTGELWASPDEGEREEKE